MWLEPWFQPKSSHRYRVILKMFEEQTCGVWDARDCSWKNDLGKPNSRSLRVSPELFFEIPTPQVKVCRMPPPTHPATLKVAWLHFVSPECKDEFLRGGFFNFLGAKTSAQGLWGLAL